MSNVEILVSKLIWLCHCAHSVEPNGKRTEDYSYFIKAIGTVLLNSTRWELNLNMLRC